MKGRSGPSINLSLGICSSYNNKSSCSDTDSDNSLYSPSDQNKDKRGRSGIEREEIDDDGGGGGGSSRNTSNGGVIEQQKKLSGCFTRLQLQQLSLQFFIFKCFASGHPLPLHILLSFWNSVAPTPGPPPPVPPSVPWTLPSAVARFRLLDMETRADPEPGRCRRTDGKKWRCSKEVVPNQKYCEKHMHRGAGRSRKLVEASKPGRLINLNTPHHPHPADADSGFSIAPASPARPAKSRPLGGPCAEESTVKRFKDGGSGMAPANDAVKTGNSDGGDAAAAAAISSRQAEGYIINNKNPPPPRTGQGKSGCSGTKIVFKSSALARNNKGGVGRASSGLDFSPKSVLQGGATLKDR